MIATTLWEQVKELTELLYESTLKAIIFVALFFEDIKIIVTATMILIAFDQFTGVWKAVNAQEFQWSKFNKLYTKLILYVVALMVTYILEKQILNTQEFPFTKGLGIVIGTQEVISTYGNISSITGKKYIKEYVTTIKTKLNI